MDEAPESGVPRQARRSRHVAQHRRTRGGRGAGERRRSGEGRSGARRLLIVVNGLVSLSLVAGALVVVYAEVQLHRIRHVPVRGLVMPGRSAQSRPPVGSPAAQASSGPPITVLIVGSDTRAGLNQPGDAGFGSASAVGGARSDTIILARIVPATKQIELLSIPRDLYLPIPGMGDQKINAAFNNGPDLLIQVIAQQLGIDVNHYVDVDFDTFRQVADAVGGVSVYFPTAARDFNSDLGVGTPGQVPGCVNLTGNQALAFVRSREYQYYEGGEWHQEAASDLARIQRQQIFIRKLINKAESTGLTNPLQLSGVISGVTKNLTVDSALSTTDMLALAKDFASVNAGSIPGITLATYAETLSSGEEVLEPETSQDKAQIAQFLALGTTSSSSGSTTTTTTPGGGTPGATTTTTTAPPTTVAPSSVAVEVANGTRVAGQATQTSEQLRSLGFDVTATVDASTANTGPTEILYGADAQTEAQTVAAYVEGPTTLVASSDLGSSSVELVTGSGFTGITSTPSASGSSSSSSTSSTTSTTTPASTTTSTTYVLPGTPTGQAVSSCGD